MVISVDIYQHPVSKISPKHPSTAVVTHITTLLIICTQW
jgi:hypothetical protein